MATRLSLGSNTCLGWRRGGLGGTLMATTPSKPGGGWSFLQDIWQEEIASGCARRSLDEIIQKHFFTERVGLGLALAQTARGSAGITIPGGDWHRCVNVALGTCFSGGFGHHFGATAGLHDLRDLFQPRKFWDSLIPSAVHNHLV